MSEKYKYWSVDLREKDCNIDLIVRNDYESYIEETRKLLEKQAKERDSLKIQRDNATAEERTDLRVQYYAKENDCIETKAELSKWEEHSKVQKRNKGLAIRIERLKDKYSRKESVRVTLVINGIEDARIISTSSMIKEDIYQLEEYGVYLTPPYYDELAKIIRDIYYDMGVVEQEFIENNIPSETVKAIVRMCKHELNEYNGTETIGEDDFHYNIPVKVFKKWYEDSAFKRFSLTSIKEALVNYGYAKANAGRNDHTVAGIGKAVSLKKTEIAKVEDNEQ